MILNEQQSNALKAIKSFMDSPDISVFILKGYAGTGKTTLLTHILNLAKQKGITTQVMAPTGRAAKVIRDKTGTEATTIHSGIYSFSDPIENEDKDGFHFICPIKINSGEHRFCIVDESSMVSSMYSEHEIYKCGTGCLLNDLLTYVAPHSGGKVIFIGDPAQLPPVGDANSMAFNETFFDNLGLKTASYELTQVMRQGNNAILRNANTIRNILEENLFSSLEFELKDDEVEIVGNITNEYCSRYDINTDKNPIVITYSNILAAEYNVEIRKILFPNSPTICQHDVVMCVKNNYAFNIPLYNGDFFKVLSVGQTAMQRKIPVKQDQGGVKVDTTVKLSFLPVVLQDSDGNVFNCHIIENLLYNKNSQLDLAQLKALYIDFIIRHQELKEGTEEFKNALKSDPLFNAVQIKFGYAITGHKTQGGEWNDVFVDFSGQHGNCAHSLRWLYTVTTRARKRLFSPRFPQTDTFSKLQIADIVIAKQFPDGFFPEASSTLQSPKTTPFHSSDTAPFIRQKYAQIEHNFKNTEFSIQHVQSCPYLEKYSIKTPSGVFLYNGYYKKNGVFNFKANTSCPDNTMVLPLLNAIGTDVTIVFEPTDYQASTVQFQQLHQRMETLCDQLDIEIINIMEYKTSYYVRYSLRKQASYSYINFSFNRKGFITYATPTAIANDQPTYLQNLIELLH